MKRTIIFDQQLMDGIAEVTNNWSAHKDRFIKFATPYWIQYYGKDMLYDLKEMVDKEITPLTCRMSSLDFINIRILMFYCINTMKGFYDFREIFDVDVEDIETANHVINYDAAAGRFLDQDTYSPEEEKCRPTNDFDYDNRQEFNRIFQRHIRQFMEHDEAFADMTTSERGRYLGILFQRILSFPKVKHSFRI